MGSKLNNIALKIPGNKSTGLNAAFNFNNFVTGKANQLATAAAKQIYQPTTIVTEDARAISEAKATRLPRMGMTWCWSILRDGCRIMFR